MRSALVTGGTGFVGSHLLKKLITTGFQAHVLVREESSLSRLTFLGPALRVHRYDGTYDSLCSAIRDAEPETVFHVAAQVQVEHQPADIETLIKSNVVFATQLVEAMVSHGCASLINTSTFWQHYENKPYSPVCLYAATKQAFECLLQYYVEATPLRAISLVLYDTYGPDDPRAKLVNLLTRAVRDKTRLRLSPGEQLIDLVYIDDVVGAYLAADRQLRAMPGSAYRRYAVSSGAPVTLKELVASYREVTAADLSVEWGGRPYRTREVMAPWNLGEPLPGWSAQVSLPEGLRRTFEAAR